MTRQRFLADFKQLKGNAVKLPIESVTIANPVFELACLQTMNTFQCQIPSCCKANIMQGKVHIQNSVIAEVFFLITLLSFLSKTNPSPEFPQVR